MILSLDVAFRNMGFSIFDKGKLIVCGSISTEKSQNKQVRISADNVQNCKILARDLNTLFENFGVKAVIGEIPFGGSQNSKAANQMGLATGIVSTLAQLYGIPDEWIDPLSTKKTIAGKRSCSKDEMMESVAILIKCPSQEKAFGRKTIYQFLVPQFQSELYFGSRGFISEEWMNKGDFEHAADSMAAYFTLQKLANPTVRMFG